MRKTLIVALVVAVLGLPLGACAEIEPDTERDDPVGTTLPEEMTPTTPGITVP